MMTVAIARIEDIAKRVKRCLGVSPTGTQVTTSIYSGRYPSKNAGNVDGRYRVAVKYHKTDIVALHFDDKHRLLRISLNTGGWHTSTTRKRINNVLKKFAVANDESASVSQERHQMYLVVSTAAGSTWRVPFREGMTINFYRNGTINNVTDNGGRSLLFVGDGQEEV